MRFFKKALKIYERCTSVGPPRLELPTVIQFPVIDICNSRCQMCRIWENKASSDITVEQLRKGLTSNIFSKVEAIGFNGGEPTLRKDLVDLVEVVLSTLPSLKHVSLITNAYKYKQVIEQIDKIGALIKRAKKNISFDVMVSLDGYGEVHDAVRGREGNFDNAIKVITHIKNSPVVDSVRIGCTVIKENVLKLAPLLDFCSKNNVYIKYRLGIPHQRLYTENLLDPYALDFNEKYELVEFLEGLIEHYETSDMQKFFYRSLINQIIHKSPRSAGCDWRHRGVTITAKGELAFCAVHSKALMENISVGDPYAAYFGNESHLQEIIKTKCDTCSHDYVGIPSAKDYRRMLVSRMMARYKVKRRLKKLPFASASIKYLRRRSFDALIEYYRKVEVASSLDISQRKAILICGWYGTETLGDKGILGGVIKAFADALESVPQIFIASINPYVTEMTRRQMPELRNATVVNLERAVSIASSMTYVAFGGGPLMAINDMAPMQVIFERARSAGVPTVVAGCGVGPLGDKRPNKSICDLLSLANIRIYRDQQSLESAVKLGVKPGLDAVAEDPAFTWLSTVVPRISAVRGESGHKVLLLGLRDFPYFEYAKHLPEAEGIRIKRDFEASVISALEKLVAAEPNLVIKPLPMCTNHFGGDDRWFYRRLFRDSETVRNSLDESLLGPEMAPEEYCKAFAAADGLLAMRFHSLVFGLGLGVKSLALDYTLGRGKVSSLAARFGVPMLDMTRLSGSTLFDALSKLLAGHSETSEFDFSSLTFSQELQSALRQIP